MRCVGSRGFRGGACRDVRDIYGVDADVWLLLRSVWDDAYTRTGIFLCVARGHAIAQLVRASARLEIQHPKTAVQRRGVAENGRRERSGGMARGGEADPSRGDKIAYKRRVIGRASPLLGVEAGLWGGKRCWGRRALDSALRPYLCPRRLPNRGMWRTKPRIHAARVASARLRRGGGDEVGSMSTADGLRAAWILGGSAGPDGLASPAQAAIGGVPAAEARSPREMRRCAPCRVPACRHSCD